MNSPTQRSLKRLRADGWFVAITERWNPFAKCRQDLFGFIDLLCLKEDIILAVQTTSGSNVAARLAKMRDNPAVRLWLQSPARKVVIHGWRKIGPRGKVKHWECREIEVTADSFAEALPNPVQVQPEPQLSLLAAP